MGKTGLFTAMKEEATRRFLRDNIVAHLGLVVVVWDAERKLTIYFFILYKSIKLWDYVFRLKDLQPIVEETDRIFKELESHIDKNRKALYQVGHPWAELW
jgi:hypothetical protein